MHWSAHLNILNCVLCTNNSKKCKKGNKCKKCSVILSVSEFTKVHSSAQKKHKWKWFSKSFPFYFLHFSAKFVQIRTLKCTKQNAMSTEELFVQMLMFWRSLIPRRRRQPDWWRPGQRRRACQAQLSWVRDSRARTIQLFTTSDAWPSEMHRQNGYGTVAAHGLRPWRLNFILYDN